LHWWKLTHTFLCFREEQLPIGLLKVGRKKLFLMGKNGEQSEAYPVCILDFYIQDEYQRCGFGKQLFDYFLEVFSFFSNF